MISNKNQKSSYYHQNIDDLLDLFKTDKENGLSETQYRKNLREYGYNELPDIKKNLWKIYLSPIFNFLILILLIAGIAVAILGSPSETIITFTVVFINSITAIIQQFRAQKALDSLKRISALKSTIIRNDQQLEIPSREITPGDIVILSQGSKIPTDGRLIDIIDLSIDEAPLTGESEPVEKSIEPIKKDHVPLQKQKNMAFMGTYVKTGRAKLLVTATGIATEIGKISESLNEMGSIEEIPLTKKLNRLGYILGIIVLINLIVLVVYKIAIINQPINTALSDSILRAMNIMPINLPLLVTLVLITGVLNMAKSGVIIKNLSSIEALGRVSVICSDKTGTMTKNEMTVEKLWINNEEYSITGSGFEAEGDILYNEQIFSFDSNPTFTKLIDSIILNNNAKLAYKDVKVKVGHINAKAVRKALGSSTEAALLVLSEKAGYIPFDIKQKYEVVKEYTFDSSLKRMTTLCKSHDQDNFMAFTKGAPEIVVGLSSKLEVEGKISDLDQKTKNEILNQVEKRAKEGYRTLAIAYKSISNIDSMLRDEIENELVFLGFVSIIDPPRTGVKESVRISQSAGIKVIMITGDHPSTAKTIAKQLNIFKEGDLVLQGKEIQNGSNIDLDKVSVFARVEPSDKEIIVKKFQEEKKKVVGMTGDGVNDSLALKLANCGISMGITGTDVAKEASDMIISDDNFTSIEKGIRIGRSLFANIRTIIYFFICLNIMEGIIFFAYEFIPFFELFSSNWQHLYIFGIVHSLPSLALVLDVPPKDIMNEPPRNDEEILNKNMWLMLLIQALLIGLGLVLVIQFSLGGIIPLNEWNLNPSLSYFDPFSTLDELRAQKARTMFITTLYIAETSFIWTFRRPNKSLIKSIKNEFSFVIFLFTTLTLILHILVIIFSYPVNFVINDYLGFGFQLNFMFLSLSDWLLCILFALIGIMGIEIFKVYMRNKKIFF